MAKKVFVSWSSDRGKKLAEALSETILYVPQLQPWVSSYNLAAGRPWFDELQKAAGECEGAVGCMTPGATQRPWVNFEAGMLFGRLKNFVPLLFHEELKGPLENLQWLNGMHRADLERLLKGLLSDGDPQRAEKHINWVYDDWKRRVDEVFSSHAAEHEIRSSAETLRDAVLTLSRNPQLSTNGCLRLIVNLSLQQIQGNVAAAAETYRSPQMDYPFHLLDLQSRHKAHVKAIALLQELEQFWQTTLGDRIRDTTAHDSSRVFVVRNARQLEEHWSTLLSHSKRYEVYVLHYDVLARAVEDRYVRDFSIITVDRAAVLASYDTSHGGYIEYDSNQDAVAEGSRVYDEILQRSVYLDRKEALDLETVKAEVFRLTTFSKKPVEMSVYVPIDDYDRHEEEHAYFQEMMDRMIAAFRERFPDDKGPYEVLEFGAGTGIFTRRLARMPSIRKIMALEIDWACYAKLEYNLRLFPSVQAMNQDSRYFSPIGRFHAVFSSFADHHIKPQDKRAYLKNVRKNLHENGVFIVGDEFLPPHATTDKAARLDALAAYHGHIIEIARRNNQDVLVQLETAAWESGKNEIGDFKLTCTDYEAHLRDGGFAFRGTRIGPPDDELAKQVGGVYVYVAEPLSGEITSQRW